MLSPAKHRLDDSAVFQPHKSREDSKINSYEWVECKENLKKSVTTISGNKITDLLLSPAKHRLDDSAVFQPHKSREDSKINSYEWVECKKNLKKSLTTISGNKITDLLLSPAKHRLDDSAVFQPHKSREDSKINSYEWVECKENLKKSVTTISGNKITDLLLSPAKHRLDDSAVFQPHKSREDSKINSRSDWVECKEKSVTQAIK